MRKRPDIVLTLPQPCSEDWNKMTPEEQGRYCASCNKIITDFTTFTDKELISFIANAKEKVCGRISPQQLNRPLVDYGNNKPKFWQRIFWGSALASSLAACHNNAPQHPIHVVGDLAAMPHDTTKNKNSGRIDTIDKNYIAGRVTNNENEGVGDVLVKLYGTSYSVNTDAKGYYHLEVPAGTAGKDIDITLQYPNNEINLKENCHIDKLPFSKDFTLNSHCLPPVGIIEPHTSDTIKEYLWVDTMPKFKGDLSKYLNDHIVYPKNAGDFQGTVYVTFIVETSGKVDSVKILRGVQPQFDSIALSAVKGMPAWTPGHQKGRRVRVRMNLPIRFTQ